MVIPESSRAQDTEQEFTRPEAQVKSKGVRVKMQNITARIGAETSVANKKKRKRLMCRPSGENARARKRRGYGGSSRGKAIGAAESQVG